MDGGFRVSRWRILFPAVSLVLVACGTQGLPQATPTLNSVVSSPSIEPASPHPTGPTPPILYTAADGNIHAVNADGSGDRTLTDEAAYDASPAWSPDGKLIAFNSDRAGEENTYVMNSDGSGARKIGDLAGDDGAPSWSPDGSKLVVILHAPAGGKHVVIDVATGTQTTILDEHGGEFPGTPEWSPTGDLIAFSLGSSDIDADIYLMRPDGTGRRLLVDGPGADVAPQWSPDGSQLTFWSDRDGGGIYAIQADGKNLRRIWTDDLGLKNAEAVWSPDGTQLAWQGQFAGEGNPGTDIFLMNIDGTGIVSLTGRPESASGIAWRH
jgi:Tol biopolymer transport system component